MSPQTPHRTRRDGDWIIHEHIAPSLHAQAQLLIEQAGSPELAKQAIEAAARAALAARGNPSSHSERDNLSP